jgi:hypothetical protein
MAEPVAIIQFQHSNATGIVLQLAKNGNGSQKLFGASIPETSDDQSPLEGLGLKLRDALREQNSEAVRHSILVLSRQDFSIMELKLPPGTLAEVAEMLKIQLAEQLPLGIDKVCFGWEILDAPKTDSSEAASPQAIQVYWAPKARIAPFIEELEKADLQAVGIIPSLAAYRSWLSNAIFSEPESSSAKQLEESLAGRQRSLVWLTHNSFEFACWENNGRILFSRGKLEQRPSAGAESQAREYLVANLERSINAARKLAEIDWNETSVVYLGPKPVPNQLKVHLNGQLSDREQEIIGQLMTVAKNEEQNFTIAPLLATARLWENHHLQQVRKTRPPLTTNMLPHDIQAKRVRKRAKSLLTQVSLLVLGILIVGAANIWFYIHTLGAQLESDRAEIDRLSPIAEEVAAMEERVASIRGQLNYAILPTDAIVALNRILAENHQLDGLFLDMMTCQDSGLITIEGHSVEDSTPWEFYSAIDKDDVFITEDQPQIQYHYYGTTRVIRFHLTIKAKNRAP